MQRHTNSSGTELSGLTKHTGLPDYLLSKVNLPFQCCSLWAFRSCVLGHEMVNRLLASDSITTLEKWHDVL